MEVKRVRFIKGKTKVPATATNASGNQKVGFVRFDNWPDYIKLKCATKPQ